MRAGRGRGFDAASVSPWPAEGGILMNIDDILEMLREDQPDSIRQAGFEKAREIGTVSVFVRPVSEHIGMETWENCARVLAVRSDHELRPILFRLFEWLRDATLPGAVTIARRLHVYTRDEDFSMTLNAVLSMASREGDRHWAGDIRQFVVQGDFSDFVPPPIPEAEGRDRPQ